MKKLIARGWLRKRSRMTLNASESFEEDEIQRLKDDIKLAELKLKLFISRSLIEKGGATYPLVEGY